MVGRAKRVAAFGLAVFASAAAAAGAYAVLGWLAVALVGLLTAFVAFQAQLDDAAPVGSPQTTGLYAAGLRARDRSDRKEKTSRRAEAASTRAVLLAVKPCGVALAAVGLAGFFLLQLPR